MIQLNSSLIAVEVEAKVKKTQSGIIIPDEATQKPDTGIVRFVGVGRLELDANGNYRHKPMFCNVGDKVTFKYGRGSPHDFNGVKLTIMDEVEVEYKHLAQSETVA